MSHPVAPRVSAARRAATSRADRRPLQVGGHRARCFPDAAPRRHGTDIDSAAQACACPKATAVVPARAARRYLHSFPAGPRDADAQAATRTAAPGAARAPQRAPRPRQVPRPQLPTTALTTGSAQAPCLASAPGHSERAPRHPTATLPAVRAPPLTVPQRSPPAPLPPAARRAARTDRVARPAEKPPRAARPPRSRHSARRGRRTAVIS